MELTAAQIPTHYQRIGQGPILVMLHGWGCDWQIFSPIIPSLSDHFQLLIPDLPAFGRSHAPTQAWTTSEYSQWLVDFLNQTVGKKPFALLGHSYGGKVAAVTVANHIGPQPTHLILCDASGIPTQLSSGKKFQQQVLKIIPTSFKRSLPKQLRARILRLSGSATDHLYSSPIQKQILVKVIQEDIRPLLPQIGASTLLIWGEKDQDTPLAHAHQFRRLIPGSELSTFLAGGHFPFIEDPARFVREITSFYQS